MKDTITSKHIRRLAAAACCLMLLCLPAAAREDVKTLTPVHAVVLGVVEGLTEYLPVSSTGHLLIAKELLDLGSKGPQSGPQSRDADAAINAYLVCIQFGAILAILFVCFHRFRAIVNGLSGRDPQGVRLLGYLILALLPTVVAGLFLEGPIKTYLFGVTPVIAGWFLGGCLILGISYWQRHRGKEIHRGRFIEDMDARTALFIGVAQCFAMWPGVSRSLATILGALFAGLALEAAVEFSFLLGALTLTAATCYDVLKHGGEMLAVLDLPSMLLGLLFAFLAAVASVKWMIGYLNRYGLELFGYYRIVIAVGAGLYYLA